MRACGSSLAARGPMERRASASLWQACPGTVLQRRVAMEVAFLGGPAVPEGQVPLSLSALEKHRLRNMAPSARIIDIGKCQYSGVAGTTSFLPFTALWARFVDLTFPRWDCRPLCPPVDGVDRVDSGGQRWTLWRAYHVSAYKKQDYISFDL